MLFGRALELAAVGERLARGRPLVLLGAAGIGKTALLREAARASGRRVYEGGGLSTLSWMSYLPISRALGSEAPPGDHAAVAHEVESRVNGGVLILDDLHWADPDTVSLLPFLAGRIALLCGVRRGDPGSPEALARAGEAGCEVMDIAGLADEDAAGLVRLRNPGFAEEEIRLVVERAGGSPLLLEELAQGEPSETLAASLRARLRRASPAAREAMARLALLARPAPRALLGRGAGELVEAGLVLDDGEALSVRHALLGDAALESLPPEDRRALHAALARLVEDPGEAARHHQAAGERAQAHAKALAAAELAGRPGERARHLAVAAACAAGGGATALRLRAASALAEAGEYASVEELLDGMESDDPQVQAETHLYRARSRFGLPDAEGFGREVAAGLALVKGSRTAVETWLTIEQAMAPLWEWDAGEAMRLATEAWGLARSTGVGEAKARYLLGSAYCVAHSPLGLEHLRAACERARETGETDVEFLAGLNLAGALEMAGDPAAAQCLTDELVERARELHLRAYELQSRAASLHLAFNSKGPRREIVEAFEQLLDEPGLGLQRDQAESELALALAELGRDPEARAVLERAVPAAQSGHGRGVLAWTRISVDWLAGRCEAAAAVVALPAPYGDWAHVFRAWALAELGRPGEELAELDERNAFAPAAKCSLAALARLVEPGREREAERLFDEAARHNAGLDLCMELRCLWGAGEAARRAGDLERARERLLAVEARAQALEMEPLLGRIRRSLRLAGVQRTASRAGARGVLTAREREVLALVGEGLGSGEVARRLGLARSTVDSQARSAMLKLGARTRRQAAALAGVGV